MNVELLPCPSCGGHAHLYADKPHIQCDQCEKSTGKTPEIEAVYQWNVSFRPTPKHTTVTAPVALNHERIDAIEALAKQIVKNLRAGAPTKFVVHALAKLLEEIKE